MSGSAKGVSRGATLFVFAEELASAAEVARDLLASCKIHDISVEDPPVEDVIRQLFAEPSGEK